MIVMTGRGGQDDRLRGLAEGADDYLVKPVPYAEILLRLRRQIERRGPREAATAADRGADDRRRRPAGRGRRQAGPPRRQGVRPPARARGRPVAGLHQAGAAGRDLGSRNGEQDPHPRLAREPAAPQARSRGRALRRQLLGRRLPPPRRVRWTRRPASGPFCSRRSSRSSSCGWSRTRAARSASAGRCTSCAGRCTRSGSRSRGSAATHAAPRPASSRPGSRSTELEAAVEGRPLGPRRVQVTLDELARALEDRWALAGVRVDRPSDGAAIDADPVRLGAALDNLVANALRPRHRPGPGPAPGPRRASPASTCATAGPPIREAAERAATRATVTGSASPPASRRATAGR